MSNLKYGIEKMMVGAFLALGIFSLFFGLYCLSPADVFYFLRCLDSKYYAPLSLLFLAISYLLATFGDFFSYLFFKRTLADKKNYLKRLFKRYFDHEASYKNRKISYEEMIFFYEKAGAELFREINTLRGQDIIFRILALSLFFDSICVAIWFFVISGISWPTRILFPIVIFGIGLLCRAVYWENNEHYDTYRRKAIDCLKKEYPSSEAWIVSLSTAPREVTP